MRPTLALICSMTALPLFSTEAAASYPISPRPLRLLCLEAELIVIARVGEPDPRSAPAADVGLHLIECLKGDPGVSVIGMPAPGARICPAPASYPSDWTVLAFLRRGKNGDWKTHALSYGSKPLTGRDLSVYRERVQECLEILRIENQVEQRAQTVEWLVRCCEQAATRWEGAYELNRAADPMAEFDQTRDPRFGNDLDESQRRRLVEALLGVRTVERGEEILIDLLQTQGDSRITPFLIEKLRTADPDGSTNLGLLMKMIARRKNDLPLEMLAREYDSLVVQGLLGRVKAGEDSRDQLLAEFLSQL